MVHRKEMHMKETFGDRIRRLREEKNFKQVQVAERQQEKEPECLVSGNAAAFADVCPAEQFGHLQFLHDVKKSGRGIPIGDVLL